ncbi:maleylacetate reductase [Cupriavidus basilensis]|uniref:Maleylacetate reductase n=1 Tax=Cupriavidus basilensis TaxID=68895 RepID=A0A7M2HD07_9BURK|nr:maleylacetate reductase [Cupriavidus basilensis]QOT82417.1 maleylacetate reductase [Cupriavidus basilensis]
MQNISFTYSPLGARVVFGEGSLDRLSEEFATLGGTRALVLCTPEQTALGKIVGDALGSRFAGLFPKAAMHVPLDIAREARSLASTLGVDCIVAAGGGSTIGLGKAIALESNIPIIAIPTTYAGSEMTPIYGITDGNEKRTGRDPKVLPRTVLYDPALTLSLPTPMSVTSGINAIAHCVEALYAEDRNPITSLIAEEGIRSLAQGLPKVVENSADQSARSQCLYGAWLSGMALGATSVALHHKLCHTLGGMLNLPHAETHTVVLPHALAYNAGSAPEAMARIARALNSKNPALGIYDLATQLGAPTSLRGLGVKSEDLDKVADAAMKKPYPNPRALERAAIRELLERAWLGAAPV